MPRHKTAATLKRTVTLARADGSPPAVEFLSRRKQDTEVALRDPTLLHLARERINLFVELGPNLTNPSPSHPQRAALNRKHTAERKRIRSLLQDNAEATCTRVATLFAAEIGAFFALPEEK
jgi:hypothetical protein